MSISVAITGVGVVSALGIGVEAFWEALASGRGGCRPAGRVEAPGILVAEVDGLDARRFARSPQGRRMDRTSLLAVAAARPPPRSGSDRRSATSRRPRSFSTACSTVAPAIRCCFRTW